MGVIAGDGKLVEMSSGSLSERVRLGLFTLSQARRSALGVLRRSALLRWRYTGPTAQRLLLVPPDLRTADPSLAYEMEEGLMGLAGTVAVLDGRSPFDVTPPSLDWLRELHGFGWLRNLAATQEPAMRVEARDLIRDWMRRQRRQQGLPWQADVVARRMISWLSHSGFLLTDTDQKFYDLLLASLTNQMRFLIAAYDETPDGAPRLQALIALLLAGLSMSDQQRVIDTHKPRFLAELERQILPDGGHISRNPELLAELLLDLLPVRQCFVVREEKPPKPLSDAIARMMPMIHFFRLGDNALARFNGSGQTRFDNVATVMAYQDIKAKVPRQARASGYYRLGAGPMQLIIDAGPPPPLLASGTAHAGCLSFELSCGAHLLFVNCGAPNRGKVERRKFARRTEAHTTLEVGGTSSGRFLERSKFDRFYDESFLTGPSRVEVLSEGEDGKGEEEDAVACRRQFAARHNGYLKSFHLWHRRDLAMSEDGLRLSGIDKIEPVQGFKGARFALRFHLHPSVEVAQPHDQPDAVDLTLPDGSVWRFTVSGPVVLEITDSIYLAYRHGPREALQILLTGLASGETVINWQVVRLAEADDGATVAKPAAGRTRGERKAGKGR